MATQEEGLAIAASQHRVTQASPRAHAGLGLSVSTAYRLEELRAKPTSSLSNEELAWWLRQSANVIPARVRELSANRLQRLAALMELLRPFAEAADDLDDKHRDNSPIWEAPAAMNITAGDLRAVRAAYHTESHTWLHKQ